MKTVVALLLAASLALPAGAQIYKWTDSTGKVHYGDKPPAGAKTDQVKVDAVTSHEPRAESTQLIMYATSWCGYCKKARAYFAAKGISYREVDIEASPANQAEFKQFGGKGVPFFIQGERRMRGFSEGGMNKFLAATTPQP